MADTTETLLLKTAATLSLTMQLMRMLYRERAAVHGQTPEEILKIGEEVKVFFEQRTNDIAAESHLTAATDEFFNLLASEVREDRESR
jgi:hypothetical protein